MNIKKHKSDTRDITERAKERRIARGNAVHENKLQNIIMRLDKIISYHGESRNNIKRMRI